MLYLITGEDAEGADAPRGSALEDHLTFVLDNMETIRVAGPVQDDGGNPVASAYVIEAQDEAAARQFIEADPYYQAGVWRKVLVRPFLGVAGTWVGGQNW